MRLSRRAVQLCAAVAAAIAVSANGLPAGAASRDALWTVVSTCRLAWKTIGVAAPCIAIRTSADGREVALLRAPLSGTHLLVSPTSEVRGLESPELRGPAGSDYLALAWAARDEVATDGAEAPWEGIGLAVNALRSRSQDQLHIHVDCLAPRAMALFSGLSPALAGRWRMVAGEGRTWAQVVPSEDAGAANPWHLPRAGLPARLTDLGLLNWGVIGVRLGKGRRGFVSILSLDRSAEAFLDSECTILSQAAPLPAR